MTEFRLGNFVRRIILQMLNLKDNMIKKLIRYILSKSDTNILHFEQNSLKKYNGSLNKMFEYFATGKSTISDCEFGYNIINRHKIGVFEDIIQSTQIAETITKFYQMEEQEYIEYCSNAFKATNEYDYKKLINNIIFN